MRKTKKGKENSNIATNKSKQIQGNHNSRKESSSRQNSGLASDVGSGMLSNSQSVNEGRVKEGLVENVSNLLVLSAQRTDEDTIQSDDTSKLQREALAKSKKAKKGGKVMTPMKTKVDSATNTSHPAHVSEESKLKSSPKSTGGETSGMELSYEAVSMIIVTSSVILNQIGNQKMAMEATTLRYAEELEKTRKWKSKNKKKKNMMAAYAAEASELTISLLSQQIDVAAAVDVVVQFLRSKGYTISDMQSKDIQSNDYLEPQTGTQDSTENQDDSILESNTHNVEETDSIPPDTESGLVIQTYPVETKTIPCCEAVTDYDLLKLEGKNLPTSPEHAMKVNFIGNGHPLTFCQEETSVFETIHQHIKDPCAKRSSDNNSSGDDVNSIIDVSNEIEQDNDEPNTRAKIEPAETKEGFNCQTSLEGLSENRKIKTVLKEFVNCLEASDSFLDHHCADSRGYHYDFYTATVDIANAYEKGKKMYMERSSRRYKDNNEPSQERNIAAGEVFNSDETPRNTDDPKQKTVTSRDEKQCCDEGHEVLIAATSMASVVNKGLGNLRTESKEVEPDSVPAATVEEEVKVELSPEEQVHNMLSESTEEDCLLNTPMSSLKTIRDGTGEEEGEEVDSPTTTRKKGKFTKLFSRNKKTPQKTPTKATWVQNITTPSSKRGVKSNISPTITIDQQRGDKLDNSKDVITLFSADSNGIDKATEEIEEAKVADLKTEVDTPMEQSNKTEDDELMELLTELEVKKVGYTAPSPAIVQHEEVGTEVTSDELFKNPAFAALESLRKEQEASESDEKSMVSGGGDSSQSSDKAQCDEEDEIIKNSKNYINEYNNEHSGGLVTSQSNISEEIEIISPYKKNSDGAELISKTTKEKKPVTGSNGKPPRGKMSRIRSRSLFPKKSKTKQKPNSSKMNEDTVEKNNTSPQVTSASPCPKKESYPDLSAVSFKGTSEKSPTTSGMRQPAFFKECLSIPSPGDLNRYGVENAKDDESILLSPEKKLSPSRLSPKISPRSIYTVNRDETSPVKVDSREKNTAPSKKVTMRPCPELETKVPEVTEMESLVTTVNESNVTSRMSEASTSTPQVALNLLSQACFGTCFSNRSELTQHNPNTIVSNSKQHDGMLVRAESPRVETPYNPIDLEATKDDTNESQEIGLEELIDYLSGEKTTLSDREKNVSSHEEMDEVRDDVEKTRDEREDEREVDQIANMTEEVRKEKSEEKKGKEKKSKLSEALKMRPKLKLPKFTFKGKTKQREGNINDLDDNEESHLSYTANSNLTEAQKSLLESLCVSSQAESSSEEVKSEGQGFEIGFEDQMNSELDMRRERGLTDKEELVINELFPSRNKNTSFDTVPKKKGTLDMDLLGGCHDEISRKISADFELEPCSINDNLAGQKNAANAILTKYIHNYTDEYSIAPSCSVGTSDLNDSRCVTRRQFSDSAADDSYVESSAFSGTTNTAGKGSTSWSAAIFGGGCMGNEDDLYSMGTSNYSGSDMKGRKNDRFSERSIEARQSSPTPHQSRNTYSSKKSESFSPESRRRDSSYSPRNVRRDESVSRNTRTEDFSTRQSRTRKNTRSPPHLNPSRESQYNKSRGANSYLDKRKYEKREKEDRVKYERYEEEKLSKMRRDKTLNKYLPSSKRANQAEFDPTVERMEEAFRKYFPKSGNERERVRTPKEQSVENMENAFRKFFPNGNLERY